MPKALPEHLKAAELKRKGKIAAGLLKDSGGEPGGFEILPDGTVRVLDMHAIRTQSDGGSDKWV